jgi:hypothetical protein
MLLERIGMLTPAPLRRILETGVCAVSPFPSRHSPQP